MQARTILAATAAWLCVHGEVGAQTIAGRDQAEGRSVSDGLEDIVVTARRSAERAQDVPISISTYSEQRLQDLTVRDVVDVALTTPSFYASTPSSDPSAALLALRGQSLADVLLTLDSPVGVYVDGVYLPRQFGLRSALIDIERVEVLKGPQGTLFGKNTTGGAVNITTRQPDSTKLSGYVDVIAGNYGRWDLTAAANLPLAADKVALRVVGQRSGHDGYGRNATGLDIAAERAQSYRANLLVQPSSRLRLFLTGDYQRISGSGGILRLAQLNPVPAVPGLPPATGYVTATALQAGMAPTPANLALVYGQLLANRLSANGFYDSTGAEPQANSYRGYGVAGTISFQATDELELKSITAKRWSRRSSITDLDGSQSQVFRADYFSDSSNFSQELQAQYQGGRLNAIVGGYYNKEVGVEQSISTVLPPVNATNPSIVDGDVDSSSIAVFGQAVYQLTDALRATAGLRWTREDKGLISRNRTALGCNIPPSLLSGAACIAELDDSYADTSYLLSLDWHIDENAMVYVKTARGFKGGGQNLRGSAGDGRSFAPYRPETVTDYEAGFKIDLLDRHLRVNAAGYVSDYRDIQRSISILFSNSTVGTLITNAAKGYVRGAELELTAIPVNNLTISFAGTYTDAGYDQFVDLTGDRSSEAFAIPEWTYSINGSYRIPTSFGEVKLIGLWSWRDDVNFRASALVDESVTQRAYGTLDARASVHVDRYDLNIALFAKNLTKQRYITGGIDLDRSLGFNVVNVGTPRLIGIELRKTFGGD